MPLLLIVRQCANRDSEWETARGLGGIRFVPMMIPVPKALFVIVGFVGVGVIGPVVVLPRVGEHTVEDPAIGVRRRVRTILGSTTP